MKKFFQGTCVENPFRNVEELSEVTENAEEIEMREFIKNCQVDDVKTLSEFIEFGKPSFRFYKNNNIFFFVWSCIEHFYF